MATTSKKRQDALAHCLRECLEELYIEVPKLGSRARNAYHRMVGMLDGELDPVEIMADREREARAREWVGGRGGVAPIPGEPRPENPNLDNASARENAGRGLKKSPIKSKAESAD